MFEFEIRLNEFLKTKETKSTKKLKSSKNEER